MADKCPGCSRPARPSSRSENVIKCSICESSWHAVCTNEETKGNFDLIVNSANLMWSCEFCLDKKIEFISAMKSFKSFKAIMDENSKKLSKHDEVLNSINAKLSDLQKIQSSVEILSKKNETVNIPTPKRSWASMAGYDTPIRQTPVTPIRQTPVTSNKKVKITEKKKLSDKPTNVIVVKAKEGNIESATNKHSIAKKLDPINDPVSHIKTTSKGKTLVFCKDNDSLVKIKEKLVQNFGDTYLIGEPKSHVPRLKIIGDIDPDYTVEDIANCIKQQNGIFLPFTVTNLKRKSKFTSLELTCNYTLFTHLLNAQRIKIGWCNAKVYEFVNAIICYKCNKIGHIEKDCTSPANVCPKCSGAHKIKECKSEQTVCPNCNENNTKYSLSRPTDHLPWSYKCPVYSRKINNIRAKIQYEK